MLNILNMNYSVRIIFFLSELYVMKAICINFIISMFLLFSKLLKMNSDIRKTNSLLRKKELDIFLTKGLMRSPP